MNEIYRVRSFGGLTVKESSKKDWNDESEKCKEEREKEREKKREREREREREEKPNEQQHRIQFTFFQEEILNYISSLGTRDGIMTEAVTGSTLGLSSVRLSLCRHHSSSFLII